VTAIKVVVAVAVAVGIASDHAFMTHNYCLRRSTYKREINVIKLSGIFIYEAYNFLKHIKYSVYV